MGDVPALEPRFGRATGAWPLLGHMVALQRRPLALLDSLPAHGDLVEIRLGPRPAYVVCHPGLARQVLTDFRLFDRTGLVYERVRTAMGNGLASAAHQDHRRQRLMCSASTRPPCWQPVTAPDRTRLLSGCGAGWRASAPRGPRCGHRRARPCPAR
jgi:pentalenene oxygenase